MGLLLGKSLKSGVIPTLFCLVFLQLYAPVGLLPREMNKTTGTKCQSFLMNTICLFIFPPSRIVPVVHDYSVGGVVCLDF